MEYGIDKNTITINTISFCIFTLSAYLIFLSIDRFLKEKSFLDLEGELLIYQTKERDLIDEKARYSKSGYFEDLKLHKILEKTLELKKFKTINDIETYFEKNTDHFSYDQRIKIKLKHEGEWIKILDFMETMHAGYYSLRECSLIWENLYLEVDCITGWRRWEIY